MSFKSTRCNPYSLGVDTLAVESYTVFIESSYYYFYYCYIQNNSDRKTAKYSSLINDLSPSYSKVVFVNLSMGAIGVMGSSCNSLLSLLHELHFDKTITKRIIMKAMNISIRSSYYIFCHRNKTWTNPELLTI